MCRVTGVSGGLALRAFHDALAALDPARLVEEALCGPPVPTLLLGAGKASVAMARGAARALGVALEGGVVVAPDAGDVDAGGLSVLLAPHPVPDARSVAAGRELLARAAAPPSGTELLLLLSGGASALAAVPARGLTLGDKVAVTSSLAAAGASIIELNLVRRHLSAIKGGRLGAAARVRLRVLVLSDVLGDDLLTIGGGPVTATRDTPADARAILDRYRVALPVAIARHLAGASDAPRPDDVRLQQIEIDARVLAGPDEFVGAAARALAAAGVEVVGQETRVAGDVVAFATRFATEVCALAWGTVPGAARALVAGGEPTISLPAAPGRGGRAQHAALVAALTLAQAALPPSVELAILCVASDGRDGPTDDAGGLVDAGTAARAAASGCDPSAALAACDAGTALAAAGALVTTGPTGTNLADLFVGVVVGARG